MWWIGWKHDLLYYVGSLAGFLITLFLTRSRRVNQFAKTFSLAATGPLKKEKGKKPPASGRKQGQNRPNKTLGQKLRQLYLPNTATGQYFRALPLTVTFILSITIFYSFVRVFFEVRKGEYEIPAWLVIIALLGIVVGGVALIAAMVMLTRQPLLLCLDCVAIQGFATLVGGKFGCVLADCCVGMIHGEIVRIQPYEGATYLAVTVLTVLFILKSRHYLPGRACSVNAFGYALFRFIWGFVRANDSSPVSYNAFLGLNQAQSATLIIMAGAVAWWFLVPRLEKWQLALANSWRERRKKIR
jgi:hypothetical protein